MNAPKVDGPGFAGAPAVTPGDNVLAMLCVSYSNRDPSGRVLPMLDAWVRDAGGTLWVQCYAQRLVGPTQRADALLQAQDGLPDGQVSELTGALRAVFRREQVLPEGRPLHRLVLVHNAQESTNDLATRARYWAHVPTSVLVTQPEWRWRVEAAAQRVGVPVHDVNGLRQGLEILQLRASVDQAVGTTPLVGRARSRL